MNGIVVVDASLVFKWLVREENSGQAQAISRSWADDGIKTATPYLLPVEVANALHRRVVLGGGTDCGGRGAASGAPSRFRNRTPRGPQPSRQGYANRRSTPPGGGL